ncbi:unnamed protein product, partial [Brassica napus]
APASRLPTLGRELAPKGTCRWLSSLGGRRSTALNYNYHRAAGRILCR